jgi:PAS domain S-box-containing protein
MEWQYTPFAIPLLVAAVVSIGLAVYAWRQRLKVEVTAFIILVSFAGWWAAGYALELSSANQPAMIFWAKLEYFSIAIIPLAWLAFAFQYTGQTKWLAPGRLVWFLVIPVLTVLLALTNEWHGLIWRQIDVITGLNGIRILDLSYGAWFWVYWVFAYLTLFSGTVIFLRSIIRSPQLYRRQIGALFIGIFTPWLGNLLYVTDLNPIPQLDLTPFTFAISGLAFALSLFRFRLLDILPVARNIVFEEMNDGVLVLDMQARIVDCNPAAERMFDVEASKAIGKPITEVVRKWPDLIDRDLKNFGREAQKEIVLVQAGQEYIYDLRVSSLKNRRGRLTGYVMVVHDVTHTKQTQADLLQSEYQNHVFSELVQKLNAVFSPEEAAEIILKAADELLSWDACSLSLRLPGSNELYAILNMDLVDGKRVEVPRAESSRQPSPIARKTIEEGKQLILRESAALDQPQTIPFGNKSRPSLSLMFVPIRKGSVVTGVLTIQSYQPDAYTERDLNTLQAMADLVGGALDRMRFAIALQSQKQLFENLVAVARATAAQPGLTTTLRNTLDVGTQLTEAESGSLFILDQTGVITHSVVSKGEIRVSHALKFLNKGLAGWVARTRQAVLVPNTQVDERWITDEADVIHSALCMPIISERQLLAVLTLTHSQTGHFNEEHLSLMQAAADQIALAMRNAQLFSNTRAHLADLRSVIESSRDGIVLINLDGRIRVTNPASLSLVGISSRPAEWINRPIIQIIQVISHQNPELARKLLAEVRRVQKGDLLPAGGEHKVGNRVIHWLHLPVRAEDELPIGRLLLLRDITEERLLEEMRQDLTHMMVHDLRSPLTAIASSLDLIQRRDSKEVETSLHARMLEIADMNVHRMLDLVNAILEINRLESGRMPLEWTIINLPELVKDVLRLEGPVATTKEIRFENQLSESLPTIHGDATLIQRVIRNLIDNAVKFTPAGGQVTIMAGLEQNVSEFRDHRQMIRVAIQDTGSGIPENLKNQLFTKFVTGNQEGRGSGLGLAFCQLVIDAHGGRIWVDNESNSGSTFHFTLPVQSTKENVDDD